VFVLFWFAALVCVASQLAVIVAAISGRTPGMSRTSSGRWKEIAWVVLPAIVLIVVLAATWHAVGLQGAGREHAHRLIAGGTR